jgi:4'-phosphopantetheinyl transferase EntD
MILKQLLFSNKIATTLFKVAFPCMASRLDFLTSQTKALSRSSYGQLHLKGNLVNLVNINSDPLIVLSVVKVY